VSEAGKNCRTKESQIRISSVKNPPSSSVPDRQGMNAHTFNHPHLHVLLLSRLRSLRLYSSLLHPNSVSVP
jgi:hypothetical protein